MSYGLEKSQKTWAHLGERIKLKNGYAISQVYKCIIFSILPLLTQIQFPDI